MADDDGGTFRCDEENIDGIRVTTLARSVIQLAKSSIVGYGDVVAECRLHSNCFEGGSLRISCSNNIGFNKCCSQFADLKNATTFRT